MWFQVNVLTKKGKKILNFWSFDSLKKKLKEKDRQLLNKPLSFDLKMDFFSLFLK